MTRDVATEQSRHRGPTSVIPASVRAKFRLQSKNRGEDRVLPDAVSRSS
jgi:hypothetical protein